MENRKIKSKKQKLFTNFRKYAFQKLKKLYRGTEFDFGLYRIQDLIEKRNNNFYKKYCELCKVFDSKEYLIKSYYKEELEPILAKLTIAYSDYFNFYPNYLNLDVKPILYNNINEKQELINYRYQNELKVRFPEKEEPIEEMFLDEIFQSNEFSKTISASFLSKESKRTSLRGSLLKTEHTSNEGLELSLLEVMNLIRVIEFYEGKLLLKDIGNSEEESESAESYVSEIKQGKRSGIEQIQHRKKSKTFKMKRPINFEKMGEAKKKEIQEVKEEKVQDNKFLSNIQFKIKKNEFKKKYVLSKKKVRNLVDKEFFDLFNYERESDEKKMKEHKNDYEKVYERFYKENVISTTLLKNFEDVPVDLFPKRKANLNFLKKIMKND